MLLLLLKTQSCVSWDAVFITHYWDPVRFFVMKLKESYFSFHPYAPKVKEYWHLIWHTITVYSISNCFPASLNFFQAFFSQLHCKVASLTTTIFFTFISSFPSSNTWDSYTHQFSKYFIQFYTSSLYFPYTWGIQGSIIPHLNFIPRQKSRGGNSTFTYKITEWER